MIDLQRLFDVRGLTAVITGGTGVLGSEMALALARVGVRVAILSRRATSSAKIVEAIQMEKGEAIGIACFKEKTSLREQMFLHASQHRFLVHSRQKELKDIFQHVNE